MKEYKEIAGRIVPVIGSVYSKQFGTVQLLDIPLMSDERWNDMCRDNFLKRYVQAHGPQTEFPAQAYAEYCAELHRECADVPNHPVPVVLYG